MCSNGGGNQDAAANDNDGAPFAAVPTVEPPLAPEGSAFSNPHAVLLEETARESENPRGPLETSK